MNTYIIVIEIVLLIIILLAYRKAEKTAKKVDELLNESEAYAYAKKRIEGKKEHEKQKSDKRAELIRELEKGDNNGQSV